MTPHDVATVIEQNGGHRRGDDGVGDEHDPAVVDAVLQHFAIADLKPHSRDGGSGNEHAARIKPSRPSSTTEVDRRLDPRWRVTATARPAAGLPHAVGDLDNLVRRLLTPQLGTELGIDRRVGHEERTPSRRTPLLDEANRCEIYDIDPAATHRRRNHASRTRVAQRLPLSHRPSEIIEDRLLWGACATRHNLSITGCSSHRVDHVEWTEGGSAT
jgi:hypothetical protein